MAVIKISELNPIPTPPTADDFFPLVDSASMTTYRVTLAEVGNALTSSMTVSQSVHATSASYASRSLSASHAAMADNVSLAGTVHYVPLWTSSLGSPNGNLKTSSPLYVSYSSLAWAGVVGTYGISSFDAGEYYPETGGHHQYYTRSGWFNYKANTPAGTGTYGVAGINTPAYIISALSATDMISYDFATASVAPYTDTYWEGSANSGSYQVIGTGAGALSSSFNGKWVRILCEGYFGGSGDGAAISMNSAKGEVGSGTSIAAGYHGRIVVGAYTTVYNGATNVNQILEFELNDQTWGGGITANVIYSSVYSKDLIKMVRASIWKPKTSDPMYYPATSASRDPMMAVDLFIDGLNDADYVFSIRGLSYGTARFLRELNVSPPDLCDTASLGVLSPTGSHYLMFPPEPGFYTVQSSTYRNYNIHGLPVTIWPTRNERTASAWSASMYVNNYSLNVSNSMNVTNRYYAGDSGGQSGKTVAYDPVSSNWKEWVYKGGILIDSSSVASDPTVSATVDTVAVGTIMAYGGTSAPNNWLECNGAILLTASYYALYDAIKNTDPNSNYGYLCNSGGVRDAAGLYFKLPDFRGEFLRGWDHNRNIDASRATASRQAASVGDHWHGAGGFFNVSNDDPLFIMRTWSDGVAYSMRSICGECNSAPYASVTDPPYGTATTNALGSTGDVRPRNVAVVYIIKYSNAVDFATGGTTLAGDCQGNVSTTTVTALRNRTISVTAPTDGQVLVFNAGTNQWEPSSISSGGTGAAGYSYLVANPGHAFGGNNDSNMFVINYDRHTGKKNVVKINKVTNVATFQSTASINSWYFYGRCFNTKDPFGVMTGSNYQSFFFSDDGIYKFDHSTGRMDRERANNQAPAGHYFDLPVSISFNPSSGSRPTVWCLYGGYDAGAEGDYPTLRWRQHYWTPGGWTYKWSSVGSTVIELDLRQVVNGTEFLKFMNDYPTYTNPGSNTLLWDFNYILGRYYLMDTSTGYLHIFLQTTGNFLSNWNGASITYEKTLAVPALSPGDWSNANAEKITVDYDPDTGAERGIFYTRRSNDALLGVVNWITWPE